MKGAAMKNYSDLGRPLRVLTWHIHGSYLFYLTQTQVEFYLPVKSGKHEGYGGKSGPLPWGKNVHNIPAEEVKNLKFDCILFQSKNNFLKDQHELLKNDVSGYIHTDLDFLIDKMKLLLLNPERAKQLGQGAKEAAISKFNIDRFTNDWIQTFESMIKNYRSIKLTKEISDEKASGFYK